MKPGNPERRRFLKLGGVAVASIPLHALAACSGNATTPSSSPDRREPHPQYGPPVPVADEATGLPLLWLPAGFRYRSFGWTGDPMTDGTPTPARHDGMAAFAAGDGRLRLVRNHEITEGACLAPDLAYDPGAGAGTTTVEIDADTCAVTGSWASLSGTVWNCAGGPTPWGSWLTCEETFGAPDSDNTLQRKHGYIFEVPVDGRARAEPLRDMGRFRHEAVAVDPATGIVYETEDRGGQSGFYRFVPNDPGQLSAGGRLQMLSFAEESQADTRTGQIVSQWRDVRWVDISDPDPETLEPSHVFDEGHDAGGARFARLEGAWYGDRRIYFVSTSGGDAERGQVWEYDLEEERLRLLYESPGAEVLNMPDNICVSPRGGLVLCEDGTPSSLSGQVGVKPQFIHGLTVDGLIFPFARNNVVLAGEKNEIEGDFRDREFAGVTYSPDGRWLFFNVQTPGISFAVTGPWEDGAL